MKLYEYHGKSIFSRYGIRIPSGFVASSPEEVAEISKGLRFPVMVKAQILAGGRGKAGGVKSALNAAQMEEHARSLFGTELRGAKIDALLVEEKVDFTEEYYLSITLDSASRMPMIIFSASGGMEIEEVAASQPERIVKIPVDPLVGPCDFHFLELFKKGGIADERVRGHLRSIVSALYRVYDEYDAMLVEINPLMRCADGSLIAADAKVDIDDSAVYRHADLLDSPEARAADPLEKQARELRFLYIDVNADGDVAIISNGSGMIMSCADWIARAGGKVLCALDLGGGATSERVAQGINLILRNERVKSILISIFGGITRCDEIAGGIVAAIDAMEVSLPIVAKLDGTNKEKGMELLRSAGRENLIIADGVRDAAAKVLSARV